SLLLYFATPGTRRPWPEPLVVFVDEHLGGAGSGRWGALRSEVKEEAGAVQAKAGGHERSRAPRRPDLAPMLTTRRSRTTALGRFESRCTWCVQGTTRWFR